MSKEINNLNNGLNNIYATKDELENTKLHYTETVSAAIVFDDLNNDAEHVPMSDENNGIMEYSFSEFQGEIPIIADDEAYLVRITYSDNTIIRAWGGLDEQDETLPSGSILWIFYSIHGHYYEPFMYTMMIGNAKASDDKTSFIFEENNNMAYFLFADGHLPDSVPIKLEFVVVPYDEADEKINNGGSEEEIINSFNSYFMETTEKTLEINNEFFKTHKFVTQDMINGIGNADNLSTNNKTIVGAINELFQSANSGKQLIADAIGNPLITGNSTFNAMSEAILGYENNLKIILTNKGVEVTEEDNMTSLINKVSSLNNGVNGVGISKDKTTPLKAIIHFNTSSVTFNTVGEHTVVDLNLTRFKNVTDKMYVTMIVTGGSYGVVAGIKDYTDNTIIHQQSMGNGYGGDSTINYAMVCDTSHDIRIFTKVTSVIFTAKSVEVYYYLEV